MQRGFFPFNGIRDANNNNNQHVLRDDNKEFLEGLYWYFKLYRLMSDVILSLYNTPGNARPFLKECGSRDYDDYWLFFFIWRPPWAFIISVGKLSIYVYKIRPTEEEETRAPIIRPDGSHPSFVSSRFPPIALPLLLLEVPFSAPTCMLSDNHREEGSPSRLSLYIYDDIPSVTKTIESKKVRADVRLESVIFESAECRFQSDELTLF